MTTSPLTDAVLEGLRRIAEIEDPIYGQQCLGKIAHELHRLRYPTHAGVIDALDAAEALTQLWNNVRVLEERMMTVDSATGDQINEALANVERHAHELRAMLDTKPDVVHQPE